MSSLSARTNRNGQPKSRCLQSGASFASETVLVGGTELLTVFDEAHDSPVVQRQVHVHVLDVHVHVADSLLVKLTLLVELFAHSFEVGDVVRIFGDSLLVSDSQRIK